MPLNESENQWQKLFQHLNYCLLVLKRTMDEQKLQIFKRVEHDVQILQKYMKSLMKYNQKRQKQVQKLVMQLKKKQIQIQIQNGKILDLSFSIQKKQQQIVRKQGIIQHLKYSKKIDASYVSSILINGNQSVLQRKFGGMEKKANEQDLCSSFDSLNLSLYSQRIDDQKQQKDINDTKTTQASSKSQIKYNKNINRQNIYGIINEEQQISEQTGLASQTLSNDAPKASSSLILAD